MELLAFVAIFVVVFLLVSKLAKKKAKRTEATRADAAIDAWAKAEVARVLAARLDAEASDVQATFDGNPDPDLVSRIERDVSSVEVVYERAPGGTQADVRVEVSFESGAVERTLKRVAWSELPAQIQEEFAKTGTAHVYRPWQLPWQR